MMSLLEIIKMYRKAYKNWASVLIEMYQARKIKYKRNIEITVILRNTKEYMVALSPVIHEYARGLATQNPRIHNVTIYQKKLLGFSYDDYNLKFEITEATDAIAEVFFDEVYSFLKVEGENVIDIGANVGDTAIYFAIKGAKKVISLEPYPYTFAQAMKNISSSEFKDRIEIINAGYGEDMKIKIDTSFIPNGAISIKESSEGQEIDLISLQTMISKYNIKSGILKMDCEGCEYYLLKETDETIRKFSMIQIEYHYGYERLVDKLKDCGFNVKYTEPKKTYNSNLNGYMRVGYIYAKQVGL
ncbi:MAG: FkbM family methyltransferase [Thermoplasmatales archaeon]